MVGRIAFDINYKTLYFPSKNMLRDNFSFFPSSSSSFFLPSLVAQLLPSFHRKISINRNRNFKRDYKFVISSSVTFSKRGVINFHYKGKKYKIDLLEVNANT